MTYRPLIPKVAAAFGLSYSSVGAPQKGYRNESYRLTLPTGEDVNLIFHKNEREALRRIRAADQASAALGSASLPVRARLDRRILKLSDGVSEVYAGVYAYLPGETIPWEAYTKNHIKLLGWAMSDMHNVWSGREAAVSLQVTDELCMIVENMEQYFSSAGVKQALSRKLNLLITATLPPYVQLLDRLDKKAGHDDHILHMDMVRGNVLFDSGGLSRWTLGTTSLVGVIDFEKAAMGHPVFDIARTLAFLLVDCAGKDRRSIYKYFLQSGYNKRGGSSFERSGTVGGAPAHRVLNVLVGLFLLHDFYKFLKHTPYESLEQNHHFVRTRDILVDYGMIRLDQTENTTWRGEEGEELEETTDRSERLNDA